MIISFIRYDWKEAETVLQENVYTLYQISKDDVKINNVKCYIAVDENWSTNTFQGPHTIVDIVKAKSMSWDRKAMSRTMLNTRLAIVRRKAGQGQTHEWRSWGEK